MRASSETVIRQALGELDIWEVEAKFVLTEHKDSQGLTVMLIKDFKDILNKVETGRRTWHIKFLNCTSNYRLFMCCEANGAS